jgi:hypothetical protein
MRRTPGGAAALLALALSACATPGAPPSQTYPQAAAPPGILDSAAGFRAELRAGRSPDCPLAGTAIHLGNGRFLTAAHLVDGLVTRMRHCAGTPIQPSIRYAGRNLPVRLLRLGDGYLEPGVGPLYRGGRDLALLQAATALPGPAAQPCAGGPARGQAVIVSSPRRAQETRAGALVRESRAADGAYADLPVSLVEGESGSGVFDAGSLCLLGVVSHRPDETPDRTRIVPAATIRAFLGG